MSGLQTSPVWLLWTVGGNKICLEGKCGHRFVLVMYGVCRNAAETHNPQRISSSPLKLSWLRLKSFPGGKEDRPRGRGAHRVAHDTHTNTHTRQWDRCLPTRGPEPSILQLKGGLFNQHDTPLLCCFGITMSKRADRAKLDWICSVGSKIYKLQAALSGCLSVTRDHRKLHGIKLSLNNRVFGLHCWLFRSNQPTRAYIINQCYLHPG